MPSNVAIKNVNYYDFSKKSEVHQSLLEMFVVWWVPPPPAPPPKSLQAKND